LKHYGNVIFLKEECYFNCESTFNRKEPSVRLIKDLNCLDGCFEDDLGKRCLQKLIEDVKKKGVCNVGSNTGINPGADVYNSNTTDCAQYSSNPLEPNIKNGTCSTETEAELTKDECVSFIRLQPPIIQNTATELISSACSEEVSKAYVQVKITYESDTCGCTQDQFDDVTSSIDFQPEIPTKVDLPPFPWNGKRARLQTTKTDVRVINLAEDGRLPVTFGFPEGNIDFELQYNFTHTRDRYSWICSLRSTELNADHFCAVTILSVPPKPNINVSCRVCSRVFSCVCSRRSQVFHKKCRKQLKCNNNVEPNTKLN
jgi:hypothetical protein